MADRTKRNGWRIGIAELGVKSPSTATGDRLSFAISAAGEIVGGGDQRDVRQGLGKITDLPLMARIIFLAEQPHIVAE
jgi:hypothetical protein